MQNLDLLSQLALKYGTDKCPQIKHPYTPFYYGLLKEKRESIKKVLEIGIATGASLQMWQEFFPNAQIYGIDTNPEALFNDKRIKSYLYDQTKESDLLELIRNIGPDLDLIVDDGSHRRVDQIFTCQTLMPLVKKDVIYIIEDAPNSRKVAQALSEYNCFIPELNGVFRDDKLVIVKNKNVLTDNQTNITIFAKPAFLNTSPDQPFVYQGTPPRKGRLMRVSSMTRGEQVAQQIGAKLNPTEGYQNDICIYVKPPYEAGQDFLFEGKKSYLDICDAPIFIDLLKKHPEVAVISSSDLMFEVLTKILPNKVVNIPEHHCNFERLKRTRKEITTIGCISASTGLFKHIPQELKEQLSARGIEFIELSRMYSRQDVVNFYLSIDIQLIWRPYIDTSKNDLRNPLKIVNSASFGIPTIMYEESSAKEMEGCYIPVRSLDEFLIKLDKLRSNPALYDQYAQRCIEKSEDYHIEKIGQLYKNLALL